MESLAFVFGGFPQRYIMAFMMSLGYAQLYILRRSTLSTFEYMLKQPLIEGKESKECRVEDYKPTINTTMNEIEWDATTQRQILHSFMLGYIIMQLPGGMISDKYGGKHVVGIAVLASSICTLLLPSAAYRHQNLFLLGRFIIGLCSGGYIPATTSLIARWFPTDERGRAGGIIFASYNLGNAFGRLWIRQFLLRSYHWTSVYYTVGSFPIIWVFLWCLWVYNGPKTHPYISDDEKEYIVAHQTGLRSREKVSGIPPFKKIFTNLPEIAFFICHIGQTWSLFTVNDELPRYFDQVLKFPVSQRIYITSFQFFTSWVIAVCAGAMGDRMYKKKSMDLTDIRRLMTGIASFGPGICLLAASFEGCHRYSVMVIFTFGIALTGPFFPGMKINPIDMSPNYAGSVMGLANMCYSICGILNPYVTEKLTQNNTLKEWRKTFWISFYMMTGTFLMYLAYGSAEIQDFNGVDEEHE